MLKINQKTLLKLESTTLYLSVAYLQIFCQFHLSKVRPSTLFVYVQVAPGWM